MFQFGAVISDEVLPMFPIGCGLDIPTGKYYKGPRGENVLNAGFGYINSISGTPNSFKSYLFNHTQNVILDRFDQYMMRIIFDSEGSMSYGRLRDQAQPFVNLRNLNFSSEEIYEKYWLTRQAAMWLDKWFDKVKDLSREKSKLRGVKKYSLTTPFFHLDGSPVTLVRPHLVGVDSLSKAKDENNGTKLDTNTLGDSKNNTTAMNMSLIKSQLIGMLPNLTENGSIFWTSVAHLGNTGPKLEMYAPDKNRVSHGKRGVEHKGVSQDFEAISLVALELFGAGPFHNSSSDKSAKYPASDADRVQGQTDFNAVRTVITRNKNQSDGYAVDLLVSKNEGVKSALTEFHVCKEAKYMKGAQGFGISGKDQAQYFDIYPDVTFSRTTIRKKLEEDPMLAKAAEITCQLYQILTLWRLDDNLKTDAASLYANLTTQGVDWEKVLTSRSWWCFEEDFKNQADYLSLMDLLELNAGISKPYWMN